MKVFVKSSFCTILITIPAILEEETKKILIKNSDLVFKIQEIYGSYYSRFYLIFEKGDKNFEDFQAILHFLKTPSFNSLCEYKIEMMSWGIKSNSKRKVAFSFKTKEVKILVNDRKVISNTRKR